VWRRIREACHLLVTTNFLSFGSLLPRVPIRAFLSEGQWTSVKASHL
jgi:hypothetical protein